MAFPPTGHTGSKLERKYESIQHRGSKKGNHPLYYQSSLVLSLIVFRLDNTGYRSPSFPFSLLAHFHSNLCKNVAPSSDQRWRDPSRRGDRCTRKFMWQLFLCQIISLYPLPFLSLGLKKRWESRVGIPRSENLGLILARAKSPTFVPRLKNANGRDSPNSSGFDKARLRNLQYFDKPVSTLFIHSGTQTLLSHLTHSGKLFSHRVDRWWDGIEWIACLICSSRRPLPFFT